MNKFNPKESIIYKIVATALFLIQILMTTYYHAYYGPFVSPVLLGLSGLGLGIIVLRLSSINTDVKKPILKQTDFISPIIWIMGFAISVMWSREYFAKIAISQFDATQSDIIPQLMFMVRRFLAGDFPYQVIHDWGYPLFPTYQSLQWLPYCIAEYFSFDYRWISFAGITLALGILHLSLKRASCRRWIKYLINFSGWGILIIYMWSNPRGYSVTTESLIAGYYLLLALAIFNHSHLLKGAAIALCLLSRYSVVLWVPLFLFTLLLKSRKKLIATSLVMLVALLLFYAPFVANDPGITLKGYQYHERVAKKHWSPQSQLEQYLFKNGYGVAPFYRQAKQGSHVDKLKRLQKSQLIVCLLFLLAAAVYYFRNHRKLNTPMFLLGSLMVYLMLFYTFIQLPFDYLFLTPLYVGLFCYYKILTVRNDFIKQAADPL